MGGGPSAKPEHLLVILPFPEPTEIFERVKKNHPHITIVFRRLAFATFDEGLQEIPKGGVCLFSRCVKHTTKEVPLLILSRFTELYHDATILVTLSTLPKSPEDCPNLGMFMAETPNGR